IAPLVVLDERVENRRAIFTRYNTALGHINGVRFMPEHAAGVSNRWLTTLTLDNGLSPYDAVQLLAEENIEARPLWKPLHTQPLFDPYLFYAH
ncbi:DegT/DnrJ/EryC1/StrS family aminotransferase, partial [Bacillus vallismortis]|nr:DegT/DnrJ/EryC1/StrS family aminotransferase [Bacillus vallismortis]